MNIIDPNDCEWHTGFRYEALRHKSTRVIICDIITRSFSCDAYFYVSYVDYNNFIPNRFNNITEAKLEIIKLIDKVFKIKAFL